MILERKNKAARILYTRDEAMKAAHASRESFNLAAKMGWINPDASGNITAQELRAWMKRHDRPQAEIDLI